MSVLSNKNVLIVGEKNSQINDLEEVLISHGVKTHSNKCEVLSAEKIEDLKLDIIILNHLNEGQDCKEMISVLKKTDLSEVIPVFILVQDKSEKIQDALALGATDYITPDENSDSVVQKMKAIFSEDNSFTGTSDIDISPIEASVTSTGIKVYVVEDDPLLRNLLSIRLDKSSFPYEFSGDGVDVLPAMKQFKPNILILDLMLPGKSGLDILAEVKEDPDLKDIPVIVFSNKDGHEERAKATELGAVGFYVKAMTDLSELVETIESVAR